MSRRRHPFRALLAVGVLLAGTLVVAALPASPASAVIPGLEMTFAEAPNPGAPFQQVPAFCQSGKKLYGGGAYIIAGGHERAYTITEIAPNNNLTAMWATAEQHDLSLPNPTGVLRVFAICGPAQPVHVLSPMAQSAHNTNSVKTAEASCPTGTRAYGVGARMVNTGGRATWLSVHSVAGNGAFVGAQALATDPPIGSWRVRAWAICATPVASYEVMPIVQTVSNTNQVKALNLRCPLNKEATGLGWGYAGNQGRVMHPYMVPTGRDSGLEARAVATISSWSLWGEVICV